MDALIARAEGLGLHVVFRNLGRARGYWLGSGLIAINFRHSLASQRVTLAHEMGHAHHGHNWTRDHDCLRDELQADQHAARLLIPQEAYARAETLVGERVSALARELEVTRRLVELRQADFARDRRIFAVVDHWRSA